MSKRLKNIIKIFIFIVIGGVLFYLAYRGQDINALFAAMAQTQWVFIVLSAVVGLLAHLSRALRWCLQLEPSGYYPKKANLFFSVMIMYLSNLAIPRSGEVVRCGLINKYENIPFAEALGTVVVERIADLIVLALLTIIVVVGQGSIVANLLNNNPQIIENIESIFGSLPLLVFFCVLFLCIVFVAIWLVVKKNLFGVATKLTSTWQNFKTGILTIIKMKRRSAFIFHSFFIWIAYFLQIYICFKAFPFTEHLGLSTALTLFVLGCYGVVVPSPGGLGTWHFIIVEVLFLFGIDKDPDGRAYALVVHGVQDVTFLVFGLLSVWLFPFINKTTSEDVQV